MLINNDSETRLDELVLDAINKNADVVKQFDIKRFNTTEAKVIELRNIKIKLTNDLRAAEELSDQLSAEFDDNESRLSELEEKLTLKLGNLGEMFGVVRQVAGQTKGEFENSISNLQFPERNDALQKLTEKRKLPSVEEIKVLWVELIKEIKNSGDIVTFNSKVANADGSSEEADVLRIVLCIYFLFRGGIFFCLPLFNPLNAVVIVVVVVVIAVAVDVVAVVVVVA